MIILKRQKDINVPPKLQRLKLFMAQQILPIGHYRYVGEETLHQLVLKQKVRFLEKLEYTILRGGWQNHLLQFFQSPSYFLIWSQFIGEKLRCLREAHKWRKF